MACFFPPKLKVEKYVSCIIIGNVTSYFFNIMVKIRLCPNLSCTRVRKYNELHKSQNFTLVIRDYVRDVSFYEQCMIQLYKNLMKFLDQDYTFIKWFYDNLQNFERNFKYYYHYL